MALKATYQLVQGDGDTLTVEHAATPPDFTLKKQSTLEQAPNSETGWKDGDETLILSSFSVEWTMKFASPAVARAELAVILEALETATSLHWQSDSGLHSWRAIQGWMEFSASPIGNNPRRQKLRVTFLPLYPRWTSTRAEDQEDYDAAAKVVF